MSDTLPTFDGWIIKEGDVFSRSFYVSGITNATGYHARMDIRQAQNPASRRIIRLDENNGRIALAIDTGRLRVDLFIAATDSSDLDFLFRDGAFIGHYDVYVIPPAGEAYARRYLMGTITYSRETTTPTI